MTENIEVLIHSSIRINGDKIIYADPFKIEGEPRNADMIFITHNHFDHFSVEDIERVRKEDTVFVFPKAMEGDIVALGISRENMLAVTAGQKICVGNIEAEAISAYNVGKPFHPKSDGWVGYIITVGGKRIYIAGDTDITEENKRVECDIALVPIGGKYTMNAAEAAELINIIKPQTAIPVHYGSVVGDAGSAEMAEEFKEKVGSGTRVIIKINSEGK
ncbi:MAG: MBL fold metallo-hydrolase [Oscillospiraceae bacterium]|nr:MBL fold metallo-hydrolase [Oscillospiraceae bacterium]